MEVASRDGKNTSLDLHPQGANFASLHVIPFEITPKTSFTRTGSAQERKQCLCMDPPGLQEIAVFTEGWDESTVCPCRNTLFETTTEMSVGLGGRGWLCPGQEAWGREGCNVRKNQPQGRGWLRGMTMSTVLLSRHSPEPRMETSKCSSWAYVY